jgi:signal transduction histidine kinase
MRGVRLVLWLDLLGAVSAGVLAVIAVGGPLAARRALDPIGLGLVAAAGGLAAALVGVRLLTRSVARPVERMLDAAERLGADDAALPILSPPGDHDRGSLGRAAVAFERTAAALEAQRASVADKIHELEEANRALAEARDSWVRSERLAAVGRLASGLAHEVGNPLGAITGYVEVARSRLPAAADPELAGALERIGAAAARIDTTIRELLDFARPSAPALAAVELGPAVEAVLRLARVQRQFRGVEVEVVLAAELPAVRADEHRLSQVLLNLLLNAADATGPGGRIEVRAGPAPGRRSRVVLTVTDDGPGIPAELLDRIFEPFFSTKEPGRGAGLGLAVSRTLVESFGGELAAGNRPGGGAVLSLALETVARPEARA